MKKRFLYLLSFLFMLLFLAGCDLYVKPSDINLPDNEIVSLIKSFSRELDADYSDIKQDGFQWYNYADIDDTNYFISGYSIEKSGVLPEKNPDTTNFFDGWHVEYVGDGVGESLIEFTNDDMVCYYYLSYDQKIPDELMAREGDYDSDEYNELWNNFTKDLTYTISLKCGYAPQGAPQFANLYFDASGEEPYWEASIRGDSIARFDPQDTEYYYLSDLELDGDNIHFYGYDIDGNIVKEECIDGGKGDTHDYKITILREGDMGFMGCADRYDVNFLVGEEGTLGNFAKKTNYQYKGTSKRENISYRVSDMVNKYMEVSFYDNSEDNYESFEVIMEYTGNGWKTLYEGDYDIDDDTCEELNQYDHNLMEMFFLRNCPRG